HPECITCLGSAHAVAALSETSCSHCENENGTDSSAAENSADNSEAEDDASPLLLS
ncbi:hypothetical protein ABG768_025719, partial [Culter alburnus]